MNLTSQGRADALAPHSWAAISAGFSFGAVKCYTMLRLRIFNRIRLAECATLDELR
jgi:hypothetical protein